MFEGQVARSEVNGRRSTFCASCGRVLTAPVKVIGGVDWEAL